MLVSGGQHGKVVLWGAATGNELVKVISHLGAVRSVVFVPDGKSVIAKSTDAIARLWDVATGAARGEMGAYWRSAISPDCRLMASIGGDNVIRLRDIETREVIHAFKGHEHFALHIVFSTDGRTLASLDEGGGLFLWDVVGGEQILKFDSEVSADAIVFSPDGGLLVSGAGTETSFSPASAKSSGDDFPIILWDVATGTRLTRLGGGDPVTSLAFSSDGGLLASGHGVFTRKTRIGPDGRRIPPPTSSNAVRLWDMKTGKQAAILKGHTNVVSSVAFSPDGRTLASSSMDGTIRLWQASSGKELTKLEGHGFQAPDGARRYAEVYSVAFSRDGKLLASAGKDGTALVWDVDTFTKGQGSSVNKGCRKPSPPICEKTDTQIKKKDK
jgi:WD40 repeat protein